MSNIREEKPNSLPAFLALVEKFQTSVDESLWFRGCGRATVCVNDLRQLI